MAQGGIAIVYYSRSGHSERLARILSERLNATLIHLVAPRYQSGLFAYLRAGFHSLRQTCDLPEQAFDTLARYRAVIICGPVWTSYPATPLRGLLRSDIPMPKTVGLFLTCADHSPAQKAFDTAEADFGGPFTATASLSNDDEGTDRETRQIDSFCQTILSACGTLLVG
ncbi:hypothetical protein SAMN04488515_1921 [Cognatiyoonia koreensis]|uniref:Flavodoxin n=1 Tax=Cognatiyoonia koreensis TaxID=364200 RepID=A0A1I0QHS9_9RHOB|nr:flavodoxin family protein [Cognatiyoonia koreensis]SEW26426.1 hypothetical protein SAMN04488515_1921 [Cognatiyoonia koreensis]